MAEAEELQQRVNAALRHDPSAKSTFSEYRDSADDLIDRLWSAAQTGGVGAALDAFDRLRASEDPSRLQYALMQFIAHYPEAAKAGLHIPPLEERNPWAVLPSNREE